MGARNNMLNVPNIVVSGMMRGYGILDIELYRVSMAFGKLLIVAIVLCSIEPFQLTEGHTCGTNETGFLRPFKQTTLILGTSKTYESCTITPR